MPESRTYDLFKLGVAERKECSTAPNGTGIRCTCPYPCVNFYLRKLGFGPKDRKGETDGP